MHMIETFAGYEELLQGCLGVFMNLRTLAGNARRHPFLNRFAKAWPNKFRADQFNRGPDPRMRESMYRVKNLTTPGNGNHWARAAGGNITDQEGTTVLHGSVLQYEARLGGFKREDVRVTALIGSHGGVVYAEKDGRNQRTGQTVSHMIGFTSHVPNVRGKLRNGCQLALLACGTWQTSRVCGPRMR